MSLTRTQATQPGSWARWAPVLRAHRGFIVAELALLIATIVMVVIIKAHPGPLPGDAGLTVWWQHLVRPQPLARVALDEVSTINWPLQAGITIAVFAAVFALLRRWLAVLVLLAMELADATNFIINQLVRRPRPAGSGVFVDRHITGIYSFPSGHVEHALAVLGIVVFLSFQVRRPGPWLSAGLWVVRIGLLAIIVLMSPSRVMEGEHWPSDGLAGLLWGGLWLLIGIQVYIWAAQRWPRLVPFDERKEALPTPQGS